MPRRSWPLVLSLAVLPALPAVAGALTDAERKCQTQVAKFGQSFIRKAGKALRRCQDRVSSGALAAGTDCTIEPRAAAGIALATQRFGDGITRRCPDGVVATLVFGGSCFGATTTSELVACQVAEHQAQVLAMVDAIYATPPEVTGAKRRCEAGVAREGAKFASRRHRLLRRCKDRIARGSEAPTTDCTASIGITRATSASAQAIQDRCSDSVVATLAFGAPCTGATTSAGLAACALGTHRDRVDRAVVVEYGGSATGGASVARQITDPADCVQGPMSRCRVNDYLLANDKIRVVVQDLQRNMFGIGQYGGQIIDADLVRTAGAERDSFEEFSTSVNIEGTAHYTDLTVLNDGSDGQAAIIRVTGVDDLLDFLNPSSVLAGFNLPFPASANDVDLPVEVMTDYILEPGTNWVRVETTVQHLSNSGQLKIYFGDFINGSGELGLFQPGYGFGEPLVTTRCPATAPNRCNYLAYEGYKDASGVSYGYVDGSDTRLSTFSTSGVTVSLLGIEVLLAVLGSAPPNHVLEPMGTPGDAKTFVRYFVVGDGTVQSIIDARNDIQLLAIGDVVGTVTVGGTPVANADVVLIGTTSDGPGFSPTPRNVVAHASTNALGQYRLSGVPGTYTVEADFEGAPFEGGGGTPVAHSVGIAAYGSTTQNIALPATGAIQVSITDAGNAPSPGKASVVGFDPSPDPTNTQNVIVVSNRTGIFNDLGRDGVPFGLTQVHFVDVSGSSPVVPIEPGSYRVVFSRGPEYSSTFSDVTVTAGATTSASGQLARVIDTTGFVASDFHVHSIDSPDSSISRAERVVTMLAEGLDFFTPSDHEFRADFAPTIAALGASGLLGTAPGGEITTFDYGHFNAWPMTIDPAQVNGGAVDHGGAAPAGLDFPSSNNFSLTPAQIIAAAHADAGTNTVQVNHIHSHFGIEGGSGLAIDTGVAPPQSLVSGVARRLPALPNYFSDTFDALEIWIGDDRGQVFNLFLGQNIGDWFNLINQGIVRTGVADSDTHVRMNTQSGVPRSMVASPTDAAGALSALADTLSASVNAGRVVGTNAPMVRVTADAASTGETGGLALGLPRTIATTDGNVDITVQIQSPLWAKFDRVEYYVNTTTTKTIVNRNSGAGTVGVRRYSITPDFVQTAPGDFAVASVVVDPMVPGASRWEATTTLNLTGLTQDVWVVVLVKGTDGNVEPLFPIQPNSLRTSTNSTLANLTDGNLGEDGMTALAFTNPIFVDVNGGGWTAPGVRVSNP